MKRLYIFITVLLNIFALTSCMEIKTSDVKDTYKYWAGTEAPSNLELLNGQYWQSSHFTKEYIMYLKFKPTKIWWDEFLKLNYIPADKDEWTKPSDAPNWFQPSERSVRYGIKDDMDLGSRYFRDSLTGVCYIYEIQF